MRKEFIERMITAKRMEVQAFQSLLPEMPEEINGHLEVISKEVKAMGKDVLRGCIWEMERVAMNAKMQGEQAESPMESNQQTERSPQTGVRKEQIVSGFEERSGSKSQKEARNTEQKQSNGKIKKVSIQ